MPGLRTREVACPWSLCGHSGQKTRARREPARTGRGPSPARSGPSRGSFQGKEIAVAQDLRTLARHVATGETPRLKAEGHCAISVQLARVMSGQPRLLPVSELGCSTASSAVICPIPKLTVQALVRSGFRSRYAGGSVGVLPRTRRRSICDSRNLSSPSVAAGQPPR